jgi:hypothetical protein
MALEIGPVSEVLMEIEEAIASGAELREFLQCFLAEYERSCR